MEPAEATEIFENLQSGQADAIDHFQPILIDQLNLLTINV